MYNSPINLRCPVSGQILQFEPASVDGVDSGLLYSKDRLFCYPVRNGIPRFVPKSNYADNFGMQWNKFRRTQLDSWSQLDISSSRFWSATGWTREELKNKWILDAGCGAGRFAEIALAAGANVVALDYSSAVDACFENLKGHPNLFVVQGDIFSLPFAKESFDFVYSLGVLQHTPRVHDAFYELTKMVKPGGKICVDYYLLSWRSMFHPKYWLRPITKRLPKQVLFYALRNSVPFLLPLSRSIRRIPLVGRALSRMIPVANYEGVFALSDKQLEEWALLDTFDWLAPAYDSPQTPRTVRRWMQESDLANIEVLHCGHLVTRGQKSSRE